MNISISGDSIAYLNGNVYTVDKSLPWAEAFIVTPDAKFAAVGSTNDIAQQAKEAQLITVDLNGSFIMPGIHDSHVHTFHSGLHLLSDINMDYSTNSSNLQPRMQEGFGACAFHNTYSDWIIGVLNEVEDYDRELLDQDWPNNPVLIHGGGGHLKYLNTLGLERAGFNVTWEPDADRRDFLRRPDGSLSGAVGGQSAMGQANMAVTRPTVTHVKRALKRALMELHRNGVTSVQEAASGRFFLEALQSLDEEGDLKMEYATHILYRNEWLTGELRENGDEIISIAREYASKHVDTRFVKIMMDGNPIVPSPTVSNLDKNGNIDMAYILEKNIGLNLQKWDEAGLTCKIHAVGSGAVRQALNNFAALRKSNPNGPRHEIAHCVSVDPGECQPCLLWLKSAD
jgi:predicted amidohydrolase YtcJ